jgi:hypothetical protein
VNHVVRVSRSPVWALAVVLCARSVAAQTLSPAPPPDHDVHFMSRAAFYLSAEMLSGDDESYEWEADFGGDLDIVDYGRGRLNFYANYQVIMGGEFRRFDPNQGNYILGGSLSMRRGEYEIAGVFHHESRHLSDRANHLPIAWNMAGGRVSRVFVSGPSRTDARIDARVTVAKALVDYIWEIDSRVRNDVQIRPHLAALFAGQLRLLGVNGTQNRGGQVGYRIEGGVHLSGIAGGMEFFLANERRIDPAPLEFGTINWVTAGFRLLSR